MASQPATSMSNSYGAQNLEWAPKCPCCVNQYMISGTAYNESKPGRKFYKCPNWSDGKVCGFLIWEDEILMDGMDEANSAIREIDRVNEEIQRLVAHVKKSLEAVERKLETIETKLDVAIELQSKI